MLEILGVLLLCLLILEPFILSKIFLYIGHKKMLETDMTNLDYDKFKELKKQISKNLNLFSLDFIIVYAKEVVVIKIKRNYFQFFRNDNSLSFLFSEDKLLKNQILKK